jgi:hypothetical protein
LTDGFALALDPKPSVVRESGGAGGRRAAQMDTGQRGVSGATDDDDATKVHARTSLDTAVTDESLMTIVFDKRGLGLYRDSGTNDNHYQ